MVKEGCQNKNINILSSNDFSNPQEIAINKPSLTTKTICLLQDVIKVRLKNKLFPKIKIINRLQEIPVNSTLLSNVGTINVEGVGPINIVTVWPEYIQVRKTQLWPSELSI
jgi:hypothetical protein